MESLGRKTAIVSRLQLLFLSATWLAGIYVNGFVPIPPGMGAGDILLNPAVESHVVLASLSAATSVFLVALAWAGGSRRALSSALLASFAIVVAGDSGLAFVLGGASDSGQSMIMATAFVTAMFLTFLAAASLGGASMPSRGLMGKAPVVLCYLALLFFYAVFVSGMYVNLFVAGPVFSLPPNAQVGAFHQSESSAPFMIHEVLGGALLVILVVFVASLWADGAARLASAGLIPTLLVAYSAYVGSLNLTSPLATGASVLVPMLSSAGLMAATIATMLLTLRIRAGITE